MELTNEQREELKDIATKAGGLALLLFSASDRISSRDGRIFLDGKRVTIGTIRKTLDNIEIVVGRKTRILTEKLFKGDISLMEWRTTARQILKASHVLAGAVASGSIADSINAPEATANTDEQIRYLERFAAEIEKDRISAEKAYWRIGLYAIAIYTTFAAVERTTAIKNGKTEVKRVRRASESCAGCIKWSGRWMPIAEMPPIGSLDCRTRCRCYLIYR